MIYFFLKQVSNFFACQQKSLLYSVWSVTHVSPPSAHAVKEDALVPRPTLSSQDSEDSERHACLLVNSQRAGSGRERIANCKTDRKLAKVATTLTCLQELYNKWSGFRPLCHCSTTGWSCDYIFINKFSITFIISPSVISDGMWCEVHLIQNCTQNCTSTLHFGGKYIVLFILVHLFYNISN